MNQIIVQTFCQIILKYNIILTMKKLKQTLGKEQTKKSKNINLSYTMLPGKKSRYDNNPAFLCKSPGKSVTQSGLENLIIAIVENYFKNNSEINIEKIAKEIIQKCQENQKFNSLFKERARLNKTMQNQELKKLEQIKELVQQILLKKEENHKNNLLEQFYQELGRVIKNKNKITKKEKLQQYDKLIKMLSPRKLLKNEKTMEIPSIMPNPVKIKFTKQEYEIKRQSSHENSLRMGSEGKRVKTAGSSHSAFKSENGNEKLKKFLQRQPSLKIIKTKIQYDYSAILEASRSKIQPRSRNITTTNATKSSGVDITTKLNKVKKNEGFVFYRPKTDHRKE